MLKLSPERILRHKVSPKAKKVVLILATSMLVIGNRGKAVETVETIEDVETASAGKDGRESEGQYPENFARILYIWYPLIFWRKIVLVLALLDLDSEINIIYPTCAKELGLPIRPTDVGAQKINGIILNNFGRVVTAVLSDGQGQLSKIF